MIAMTTSNSIKVNALKALPGNACAGRALAAKFRAPVLLQSTEIFISCIL
jgi:hypothetical protein